MSPNYAVLTPDARRHIARMGRAIAPAAPSLQRAFARTMTDRGYGKREVKALSALTPAAASGLRTIAHFLEQVEYTSRRLAKLNVPPGEALEALREFGELLDPILGGRFEPAREQLLLATSLVLNQAYFQVRESEARALFGIYGAETEAAEFPDFLERLVRILTPALRARRRANCDPGKTGAGKTGATALYRAGTAYRSLDCRPGDAREVRIVLVVSANR